MAIAAATVMAVATAACGGDGGESFPPGRDPASICARWTADRLDLDEGTWSGDLASCSAGDISAGARQNALRLVNLYRWLAELPEVTTDAARNAATQECALMMHANTSLMHNPPPTWLCYTADGAMAAGSSNIATTPGVTGVDLYMFDPGNPTTLGHRRWILSNRLGPIGLGSTDGFSCMWVLGGSGSGAREWTAYPPPGVVPLELVQTRFGNLDTTGWSVQSDSIDLSAATVTVRANGQTLPVIVSVLLPNYGSSNAIAFAPDGWMAAADTRYQVEIGNIDPPIEYEVRVTDCAAL